MLYHNSVRDIVLRSIPTHWESVNELEGHWGQWSGLFTSDHYRRWTILTTFLLYLLMLILESYY